MVVILTMTGCKVYKPQKYVREALASAPFDAIIVPGMPYDSTWTDLTKERMYWAKYLWENGYTKNVIFSGAAVYTEYAECKVMKLYAMKMGIPEEHIFLDSTAEHSVENLYYSYYLGRHLGFKNIAVATDVYQSKLFVYFNKKMKRRIGADIKILPVLMDTLQTYPKPEPEIDPEKAIAKEFKNINKKQNAWKRLKGTLGQNIDWDNPPPPPPMVKKH